VAAVPSGPSMDSTPKYSNKNNNIIEVVIIIIIIPFVLQAVNFKFRLQVMVNLSNLLIIFPMDVMTVEAE
jgi:hypothetical protein